MPRNDDVMKIIAGVLGAGLAGAIGLAIKSAMDKDEGGAQAGSQPHGDADSLPIMDRRDEYDPQIVREQEESAWTEKQMDEMWEEYHWENELRIHEEEDLAWTEKQMDEMWEDYHWENELRIHEEEDLAWQAEQGKDEYDEEPIQIINIHKEECKVSEIDFTGDEADIMARVYDESEEDESAEASVIDNTDMSFNNRPICIKLNDITDDRKNRLDSSEKVLCKRFDGIKTLSSENRLQRIVDEVFPDGFQKHMYIRNLSFTSDKGNEITVLGIRPEIYDGDFLNQILPEGCSLLFKGHLNGRVFTVDGIYEIADTECLSFEVEGTATPYDDMSRVAYNFLYEIKDQAESLTKYTSQNLNAWREYLSWKKELAKRQIFGCKYYKITYDEETNRLVFWLVCKDQDYFNAFIKYLYRDVQAFNNDYSSDEWVFELADMEKRRENRKRFDRSIELGRCRGVVKEYYLDPNDDPERESSAAGQSYDMELDEENDYEDETEADIYQRFETPYIVQVAFELNRTDSDVINERNLEGDEITDHILENVLGNYYPNGFLALSAVGDFVLIERFQQAIGQLERDECYSPNLATWLFNVQQARLPDNADDVQIDRWLNPNIEANENQKEAVRKMISAPDLCLIQGPPGTGKTTVIAEAIYQFARRGNRVLVVSQSNDAVDNALERLADTPEIRAIRLGQKGRHKRKDDKSNSQKYSEDTALLCYYHALSQKISRTWLDRWTELEARDDEYTRAIRDARLFNEDIAELNQSFAEITDRIGAERKAMSSNKAKLEVANEHNTSIHNEKRQLQAFEAAVKNEDDGQFFLTETQIRCIEPVLNSVVSYALNQGVYLAPAELNFDALGNSENGYIAAAIRQVVALSALKARVNEADTHTSGSNAEAELLQLEKTQTMSEISAAIEDDNDELLQSLRKKLNRIKLEIDKIKNQSSVVEIGFNDRQYLTPEFQALLNSENRAEALEILSVIENKWCVAVTNCITMLSDNLDAQVITETEPISEQIRIAEGRLKEFNAQRDKLHTEILQKQNTLRTLSDRYGIGELDADTIIESIRGLQQKNQNELEQQRQMRAEWESTLRSFQVRLDDKDSYAYDQEYYQQIYVNACNVVGISCTDNMRNLTDNGYDDFDVVIIDEVSKATPPELLIPLMKARKAILVGDHRQLPPMFKEHEGSYEDLVKNQEEAPEEIRSLLTIDNFRRFKKMVTASLFKEYFENADDSIKHPLLVQYRMHSDIMDIINRFYDRRLSNGLSAEQENEQRSHNLSIRGIDGSSFIIPRNHAYWIDSSTLPSGKPVYETFAGKSTSATNFLEVYIIVELLKKIADSYRNDFAEKHNVRTVGVISFYQSQVREIRDAIKAERKHFEFSPISIDVNTVDRFQGKEKNIVITSLVRNNRNAKASEHVIAFERINVAFSRAQNLLVIVGAKHMYEGLRVQLPNMDTPGFKTAPVYKNIMDDLQRKACFRSSDKIISPELESRIVNRIQESGEGKK